jgi:hypothetical protein
LTPNKCRTLSLVFGMWELLILACCASAYHRNHLYNRPKPPPNPLQTQGQVAWNSSLQKLAAGHTSDQPSKDTASPPLAARPNSREPPPPYERETQDIRCSPCATIPGLLIMSSPQVGCTRL